MAGNGLSASWSTELTTTPLSGMVVLVVVDSRWLTWNPRK
jgi:hypothetical protein